MTSDDTVTSAPAAGTAATFCATLVDEWVRGGITDAVVAPGSRSTPMALALANQERLRLHTHHDERSAGFLALGLGLASGRPALVLTTSGTAAAELHPAVAEAHHAGVPLIVLTADRPPELADVGAAQTIDQTRIYGAAVRSFVAPGVPDEGARQTWRSLASRAVLDATGSRPGPVHLDLAFREPLLGDVGDLPPARSDGGPWHRAVPAQGAPPAWWEALGPADPPLTRGVVVAGGSDPGLAQAAADLAATLRWPLLPDARVRVALPTEGPGTGAVVVAAADAIARTSPAALTPTLVLRLGDPPASRVLGEWLAAAGPVEISVGRQWTDPGRRAAAVVLADPVLAARELTAALAADGAAGPMAPAAPGWPATWARAEAAAAQAMATVLATHPEPTEPGIARAVVEAMPAGTALVVSSSMPVRDVEWYARPRAGVSAYANRGANGIDGVTSTAVGVALACGRPTVCLIGDVAFLHDTNGLLRLADRDVTLTIVVVDNDGGGIFSFLPQAGALPPARFERLYGTPHGVDIPLLAAAHGLATLEPATAADVGPAVSAALGSGGVRVVRVRTDRATNVDVHDEIHRAVAEAVGPILR